MARRPTSVSMNDLADQLNMPRINMDEDKLNALSKANGRVTEIMGFMDYLSSNGVHMMRMEGPNVANPISSADINNLVLGYVGVSKEDAETAARYIVEVMDRLQGK